ncbi:MAG: SAM-dependent methyltransferase [Chloroflexi bacterium]|nr:SAM-dependent methyltransferase [Chloroflexota bacterium]MCI0577089.1 SAM-dependent methyltransferase [Chloroflexota bacterium]MCI0650145.1 SAM-dependent methyltransferase [Chloroflexota bacterium]
MSRESIVDTSRPNAGRIYDYLLGGSHNFEVDRQAAERIRQLAPFLPKAMRLQRWCLQDLAVELTKNRGYDVIIDFASGLPTNDHIHRVVPPGTTVIYSDYDPVVVEYAHEILAGTPDVYFFQADARRPEELLERQEVREILAGRRNIGLAFWGVSGFIADDELAYTARRLYEWAGPDSCLAFNAQGVMPDPDSPEVIKVMELYRQTGAPLHIRSLDRCVELLQPWSLIPPGFISLLDWHGLDTSTLTQEDIRNFGPGGGGYGAYLAK